MLSTIRVLFVVLLFTNAALAQSDQTITFPDIPSAAAGSAPIQLAQQSSANLAIIYTSSDPAVATMSGNVLTPVAKGLVLVTATQPGNADFNAAPTVTKSFVVTRGFDAPEGKGQLWGMAAGSATNAFTTVFKMDAAGNNLRTAFELKGESVGYNPQINHISEFDGKWYGLMYYGGDLNRGVLYEFDPATNEYTVRHEFSDDDGGNATGNLILINNKFYGLAGPNNSGSIFEFDPVAKEFNVKVFLTTSGLYTPGGSMVLYNGKLYGLTMASLTADDGGIFEYDPVANTIISRGILIPSQHGTNPGNLVVVGDRIVGSTTYGGPGNKGTIFDFDPTTGNIATRVANTAIPSFGAFDFTLLNGKLYFKHYNPVSFRANIMEYDPVTYAVTEKIAFDPTDTNNPYATTASLVVGPDNKLYSTGAYGTAPVHASSIFTFNPSDNSYEKVYDFDEDHQFSTYSNQLTFLANGKIVGTADTGGDHNDGFLFEFDPATNQITTKRDFAWAIKGYMNQGTINETYDGKLVGISEGGENGLGGLYEIDPKTGSFKQNVVFDKTNFHLRPDGKMTETPDGKLYYITSSYFTDAKLIVYDRSAKTITELYTFSEEAKGKAPKGSTAYFNGKLYGITSAGGDNAYGSVYEFDLSSSTMTALVHLSAAIGYSPSGGLFLLDDGAFLFPTTQGGTNSKGSMLRFNPIGNDLTIDAAFDQYTTGYGDLTMAHDGQLYSISTSGGNFNKGRILLYNPDPLYRVPIVRAHLDEDAYYLSPLVVSSNGKLYSSAYYDQKDGKIIELDPAQGGVVSKFQFDQGLQHMVHPFNLVFVDIDLASQTITFNELGTKKFSDPSFDPGATTSAGQPVTYTSSNLQVAKIVDGKIVFMGVGTTTITAYAASNATYDDAIPASQTLTVVPGDRTLTVVPITDKTAGDPSFTVSASDSGGLPVILSSNNNIVTVDGITVTILNAGTATIVAKSTESPLYNDAEDVSISFCVNPKKPTVKLSGNSTDKPILTSSGAAGWQWYENGTKIDGATQVTFQPAENGSYQVSLHAGDCESELSTATDVTIVVTGLEDDVLNSVALFPNPSSDRIMVRIPHNGGSMIDILDTRGSRKNSLHTSSELTELDVISFPAGMYFLKVQDGSGNVKLIKFVKQ
jgi:hypothetical protein